MFVLPIELVQAIRKAVRRAEYDAMRESVPEIQRRMQTTGPRTRHMSREVDGDSRRPDYGLGEPPRRVLAHPLVSRVRMQEAMPEQYDALIECICELSPY
jgi:hypothetical protein